VLSYFDPLNYGSAGAPKGQGAVSFFGMDHAPPFTERPMEAVMVFLSHVRSVGVAYLLVLGFGALGAHRFYLRKIRSGVVMALLSLASAVLLASHDQASFRLPRDLGYVVAPVALGIWLAVDVLFLSEAVRVFNLGLRDRIINGRGV
jgi:TM2 domain-containing membrane protein YozV